MHLIVFPAGTNCPEWTLAKVVLQVGMDKARANNRHMEVLLAGHTAINPPPTRTHTAARRLVGMAPARIHMEAILKAPTANNHPPISHPIRHLKRQGMVSHQAMVNHLDMARLQVMVSMGPIRRQGI